MSAKTPSFSVVRWTWYPTAPGAAVHDSVTFPSPAAAASPVGAAGAAIGSAFTGAESGLSASPLVALTTYSYVVPWLTVVSACDGSVGDARVTNFAAAPTLRLTW